MTGGGIGRRTQYIHAGNEHVLEERLRTVTYISGWPMQGANPCPVIARLLPGDVSISRYTRGR